MGELFIGIKAWININTSTEIYKKVSNILKDNGAEFSESISKSTHIITSDWQLLKGDLAPADKLYVTPQWVLSSFRYKKLFSTQYYSPDPSKIFSGIIVCTSQLPISDTEMIFGSVSAFGGQWRKGYVPEVTHLITCVDDGPKYRKAISEDARTVVVSPHWFDDCLKLKKRLDESHYCYPSPLVLDPKFDPVFFHFKQINSSENCQESNLDEKSDKTKKIFAGLYFYFDHKLDITNEDLESLCTRIKAAGAVILDVFDASRVTCYVCQDRESSFYNEAVLSGAYVGTLTWISHILITCRFDPPARQLLFYPTPSKPATDMQSFTVSITNYSAVARQYLQRLLEAMGATYTPYLAASNTHLICASPTGLKFEKAQEWNVIVVNHLWVEDCFRAWQCQAVTKAQYTHFPAGICLDSLVGIAPYSPADLVSATDNNNQPVDSSQNSDSDVSCNVSSMGIQNSKPLRVPRKAANSATQALSKLMEAQNQYEHIAKNKLKKISEPPLALGGAIEADAILPKRSASTQVTPVNKKPPKHKKIEKIESPMVKKTNSASTNICILFTGHTVTPTEKKNIRSLGGKIVTSTEECTHLISATASRTAKFLCAISRARIIVTPQWLVDSFKEKVFLDETSYFLQDKKSEKTFGFSLKTSIKRAREKKLLLEYEFAITPSVTPEKATLSAIIEAAGGTVLDPFPKKRLISDDAQSIIGSSFKLVILSCAKDLTYLKTHLSSKFASDPSSIKIYTPELVLSGSLQQDLDFSNNILVFQD